MKKKKKKKRRDMLLIQKKGEENGMVVGLKWFHKNKYGRFSFNGP